MKISRSVTIQNLKELQKDKDKTAGIYVDDVWIEYDLSKVVGKTFIIEGVEVWVSVNSDTLYKIDLKSA